MNDYTAGVGPVLPPLAGVIKPVVLAAGVSRRLGRPKQLLRWGEKALIAHAVDAVLEAQRDLAPVSVVVTSRLRPAIAQALGGRPILLIDNPIAEREGMASSLRLAVAAARSARANALMLLLSDQPLVDARSLRRLLAAWADQRMQAVASTYDGVIAGVPAILPKTMFTELAALRGDVGARAVLRSAEYIAVDMPNAALDIDRPEDLATLRKRQEPPQ
ncbi:MAG: nucleotidyltransferase family protein [Pseudomonadota bacterium]